MKTLMKGGDFIFDAINLLCQNCHKVNLNCAELCIDSADWIKDRKITINSINDDYKFFQCTASVAFNLEEIGQKL